MKTIDWNDLRRKMWHAALVFGSAYAAHDARFTWLVPVLTGMAGQSAPPSALRVPIAASASLLVFFA